MLVKMIEVLAKLEQGWHNLKSHTDTQGQLTEDFYQTGRSWTTRNLNISKYIIIFKFVKNHPKYHFF